MTEQWLVDPRPDEVLAAVGGSARSVMSAVTDAVAEYGKHAAERAREQARQVEAQDRRVKERLDAEYEAEKPLMRQAWDRRWWAEATPERVGRAWQACTTWAAHGFPFARTSMERMREEIRDRYDVEVDPVAMGGPDVAARLAEDPETVTDRREAPAASGKQSVSFVVRDTATGEAMSTDTARIVSGYRQPIPVLAAERLADFEEARNARLGRPEELADRFVIEVYDGEDTNGDPAGTFTRAQADEARGEFLARHERLLSGQEGFSAEERHGALAYEQHRIAEELDRLDPTMAASPEGHTEQVVQAAGLRQRQAQVGMRMDIAAAEMRGEDGEQVVQAAALRRELDERWWQTATPEEVAGVYRHVEHWSAGEAKRDTLSWLRDDIARHHGVDVGPEATPERVGRDVHRGQAVARGETVLDYRIDVAGEDGRYERASGVTTVPGDEAGEITGRRLLSAYAGGPDRARRQGLRVSLSDHTGAPVAVVSAADLAAADSSRRHAREETAEADRAEETGERLEQTDPPTGEAWRDDAEDLREAAEQDSAAAGVYERMGDRQAAQTAQRASKGFTTSPSARLRSGGGDRDRLGPARPSRTRGVGHRPRKGLEPGR